MAGRLLENMPAEQEANNIGAQFVGSNDVMGDMGKTFNFDFSNVQMIGGDEGEKMTKEHGDLAYAQGNKAYFGQDILNQHTPEANMAVGHELTHVMQQNKGAGVSEHVPFGESQGLGFFDKVKGYFRNMFMNKQEKKERKSIFNDLRAFGAYEDDDKYETTDALKTKQTDKRNQIIEQLTEIGGYNAEEDGVKSTAELLGLLRVRRMLIKKLTELNAYVPENDKNKSNRELNNKLSDIKVKNALDTGNAMEVVEFTEQNSGVETSLTEENKTELENYTKVNWEAEKDRQEKDTEGEKQGLYKFGKATELGAQMIQASEGIQTAIMLIQNTPLYKTVASIYEKRSIDKKMFTRLFTQVKPVYLNDKGEFASARDEEYHKWNVGYLKSLTINPTDTSFVDGYLDEILSMEEVVKDIMEKGESAAISNMELFHRIQFYPVTIDQYEETKVFKEYLKSQNGGEIPESKEKWPKKVKAANALATVMGDLAARYISLQGKNGLGGEVSNLHFAGKDEHDTTKIDKGEEAINVASTMNWGAYEDAKKEFLAEGGVMPKQVTNAAYKKTA